MDDAILHGKPFGIPLVQGLIVIIQAVYIVYKLTGKLSDQTNHLIL
jgi:hypothetical protein